MDFRKQLEHYRLATAEILYHLPDHPSILQSFIWQELDIAPEFPGLHKFLVFLGEGDRREAALRPGAERAPHNAGGDPRECQSSELELGIA
jgi:hypothetical protein